MGIGHWGGFDLLATCRLQIPEIALKPGVTVLQNTAVAIVNILEPGNQQKSGTPDQVLLKDGQWRDQGNRAGGVLVVVEILDPFTIETRHPEVVHGGVGGSPGVSAPPKAFDPLAAVRRHAHLDIAEL